MQPVEIFGLVCSAITIMTYMTQFIHSVKNRTYEGLSMLRVGLDLTASISWTTFGVLTSNLPVILSSGISGGFTFLLICLIIYDRYIKRYARQNDVNHAAQGYDMHDNTLTPGIAIV